MAEKKNNKDTNMLIVGFLALLFMSFKKKPQPSVEVGEGHFGDFGTDGDFEETAKAPIGKVVTSKVPMSVPLKTTSLNTNLKPNDCGCH